MATWTPPGRSQKFCGRSTVNSNCAQVTFRFEQASGCWPFGGASVAIPVKKAAFSLSLTVRAPVAARQLETSARVIAMLESRVIEGSFQIRVTVYVLVKSF